MGNNKHVVFLNDYIKALILNIDKARVHKKLNLVFDSGALNGIYGMGAALYIHNLERIGYINVKKVSGCSIGSLIGLWYLCGCPAEVYSFGETLFAYYKTHKNFFIYKQVVTSVVAYLFATDDMSQINGRLYINCYDTKKCKQHRISHYKNRAHLITCILRSSHVPFLTNGATKYADRYIDGIAPYFLKKNTASPRKNLFINLFSIKHPLSALNIKNEHNIYTRLIKGVIEANEFFVNGKSDMCKYVDNESYLINFQLYLRENLVLIILALIEAIIKINQSLPLIIRETIIYKQFRSIITTKIGLIQTNLT
jgi:hypothetical protein